jgi:hypothetical protein
MPNGPAKKIPLVSYVCQGKCLQAAWTLPGMPDFFSDLIVQKTKKFNDLRRFWGDYPSMDARLYRRGQADPWGSWLP